MTWLDSGPGGKGGGAPKTNSRNNSDFKGIEPSEII